MPNDLRVGLPFVTSGKYKNNDAPMVVCFGAQPVVAWRSSRAPLTVDWWKFGWGHVRLGTVLMRTYDELI